MTWIKKQVWQLGIAALLLLAGTIIIYISGTNGEDRMLLWVGLGLVWFALFIPLLSKAFGAKTASEDEEDQQEDH